MANQLNYIPNKDSEYALWAENFASSIQANPLLYGLSSGDATTISQVNSTFQSAYSVATDPATRTSPAVQAKTNARNAATEVFRMYAQRIRNDVAVSDEAKLDLGINLKPVGGGTPVPEPVTNPELDLVYQTPGVIQLTYQDSSGGPSKRKPSGVVACELWIAIGDEHAVSSDQTKYAGAFTKSPMALEMKPEDSGKKITIYARWATASGPGGKAQVGPFGSSLQTVII